MDLNVTGLNVQVGQRLLIGALGLSVQPGQLWCVLGRNGAGKSTLLRTLAGLRRPAPGAVLLNGQDLLKWSIQELARMRAFLPQQQTDTFSSSVIDTVLSARYPFHTSLSARLGLESAADRRGARTALQQFKLEHLAERDVLSLSGGERRLVALATIFAQDTELLLLDEPAAHLDVDVAQRVFGVLRDAAGQGQAVLATVHDPNLAARFATHVLQLQPGGSWLTGPVLSLTAASLSETFSHRIEEVKLEQGVRFFAG
jgi:iron complex transport system ATP-binding protein